MSLGHGASIVRNGLVFHYDASNTQKSWKGKPTTNLISYPNWASGTDNNFTGWTRDNANINVVKATYLDKSCIKLTRASGDTGWNGIAGQITQLLPNTTYTETIKYAVPSGMSQPIRFYLPEFNSSGTVINYRYYLTAQSATDGWKTFTYTFTTDSTAVSWGNYKIDWYITASTGLETIYIESIQLEQNSFATPFVAGVRSDAQSILDLTKNNTITVNNLTYTSTGGFTFNGSSRLTTTLTGSASESAYTRIVWVKPTATSGEMKSAILNQIGNNSDMAVGIENGYAAFHQYTKSTTGSDGDYSFKGP